MLDMRHKVNYTFAFQRPFLIRSVWGNYLGSADTVRQWLKCSQIKTVNALTTKIGRVW